MRCDVARPLLVVYSQLMQTTHDRDVTGASSIPPPSRGDCTTTAAGTPGLSSPQLTELSAALQAHSASIIGEMLDSVLQSERGAAAQSAAAQWVNQEGLSTARPQAVLVFLGTQVTPRRCLGFRTFDLGCKWNISFFAPR